MPSKRPFRIATFLAVTIPLIPIFIRSLSPYAVWFGVLGMFIFTIPYYWAVHQAFDMVNGITKRRDEDVSAENHQPSRKADALIGELIKLGFARLGEARSQLRGQQDNISFLLNSPEATDFVEVADLGGKLPAMLQFTSVFADEAVLETLYPLGANKDFPQHRIRVNSVSVKSAYDQHSLDRFRLESQHGAPRTFPTMAEYLAWDGRYRELYARNKLRGRKYNAIMEAAMVSTVWVLAGGFALAASEHPPIPSSIGWLVIYAGLAVFTGLAIIGLLFTRSGESRLKIAKQFIKSSDKTTR